MMGSTPIRFRQHPLHTMARGIGNRQKKINVGKETRRRARKLAGVPPTERIIPDKRRKPEKHKKKWMEEG